MSVHVARFRHVVILAAAIAAACGGGDPSSELPIRLTADPSVQRDERFLVRSAVVTIGDLPRPVLTASEPIAPASEVTAPPGEARRVGARIPAELKEIPWTIFETVVTRNGKTSMMRSWPVAAGQAGSVFRVPLVEDRVGTDGVPSIRIWPVPDLAKRDIETGDVRVPSHALLQVGAGLEEASWATTALPVEMTVTALAGGRETVLRAVRIDPRRRADQGWIDLAIPLDPLAGQTVHFRFSARPIVGPTAVPSLPVWAEPTIVDASLAP